MSSNTPVEESGAAQQEGELGAIVRGNPARIGLKGHADELVGFDQAVGYRYFQMEVTGMMAADGAESPAVDGTGDGHGTGHFVGDFRDGELGGENQVAHVLHAEAELGAGGGPSQEAVRSAPITRGSSWRITKCEYNSLIGTGGGLYWLVLSKVGFFDGLSR